MPSEEELPVGSKFLQNFKKLAIDEEVNETNNLIIEDYTAKINELEAKTDNGLSNLYNRLYDDISTTSETVANLEVTVTNNTNDIQALADKIDSLEVDSSSGSEVSIDILTTIMILQDNQPGQVVGLGIYLDCLTDQSTFTIIDGFYDSSKKLIYVG